MMRLIAMFAALFACPAAASCLDVADADARIACYRGEIGGQEANPLVKPSAIPAAPTETKPTKADFDFCKSVGDIAQNIMRGRQNGVPMSRFMTGFPDNNSPQNTMVRMLIIQAYDSPNYQTDKVRATQLLDFRNDAELSCYQVSN